MNGKRNIRNSILQGTGTNILIRFIFSGGKIDNSFTTPLYPNTGM
jgi:hypothetical protein